MNEAIHHIRQKIYTALNGNVSLSGSNVPVYNRVPTNSAFPYIWIYSLSTNEIDQNASKYNSECITRIECITRFDGDQGGDLNSNLLVNSVVSLLRTRSSGYFNLSASGFKVYTSTVASINYVQEDENDHSYFKGIIELSNRVEQTS
jgi:hypothetical protein